MLFTYAVSYPTVKQNWLSLWMLLLLAASRLQFRNRRPKKTLKLALLIATAAAIHLASLIYILTSNEWVWHRYASSLPSRKSDWMWSGAATSKSFAIMIRGYGGSDLVVSDSTGHSVFEFNIPVSNTYDVMRVDVL